jgi:hypothetical protein
MYVFILESLSANDLIERSGIRDGLESLCRAFGHHVAFFALSSLKDFQDRIWLISQIELKRPTDCICIHIQCHGSKDGIGIGPDFLPWDKLADSLDPLLAREDLAGRIAIVLGSCYAKYNELSFPLRIKDNESAKTLAMPELLLVYDDDKVHRRDALINWAVLYYDLSEDGNFSPDRMTRSLTRMKAAGLGDLLAFSWNRSKHSYKVLSIEAPTN